MSARPCTAVLLLVAVSACAAPAPRQAWEREPSAHRGRAELDLAAPPPSDLREPEGKVPAAAAYPAPPGGRVVATAAGPARSVWAQALAIPPELWLPAAPQRLRAAIVEGELAPDLLLDGTLEADVDGDGAPELVVLARPAAAFEEESPERVALLLALARQGGGYRLAAAHVFAPQVHEGNVCHGEWRLAGLLRRGRADVPLVFEERGVSCSQRVGGGFDRALWAVDLGRPGSLPAQAVVARARLGANGAADLHEAVAWAADVDHDGAEELVVRGVSSGARPCGGGDPAFWVEELAYRVIAPGADPYAMRDGRVAPAPDGVLPAQLLASHPAACGAMKLVPPQ